MSRKKNIGNEPQYDGEADLIEREAEPGTWLPGSEPTPGDEGKTDAAEEAAAEALASTAEKVGTAFDRAAVKRANFSRLASKRVTGVLERLSVLKNLANTNTYDWTEEQYGKIFGTIEKHLDEVQTAFINAKKTKVRDKSQLRFEV